MFVPSLQRRQILKMRNHTQDARVRQDVIPTQSLTGKKDTGKSVLRNFVVTSYLGRNS